VKISYANYFTIQKKLSGAHETRGPGPAPGPPGPLSKTALPTSCAAQP